MSNYVIGDIQGCYDNLQNLLQKINYNEHSDQLWLVGDLVNRGPDSLAVLRFIKSLPIPAYISLGNHDLHLLTTLFASEPPKNKDDTLQQILIAEDREELGHWLRKQAILVYNPELNVVMTHAGVPPIWDLTEAQKYAKKLEAALQNHDFQFFLSYLYGNQPNYLSKDLTEAEELRVICNYFTRMRFCYNNGHLDFSYKGNIANAPPELYPWYAVPERKPIAATIVFGHWAALNGNCPVSNIFALDTGCVWGGKLTALRLEDKKCFSVPGLEL